MNAEDADRGSAGVLCVALCAVAALFVALSAQVTIIGAARHRAAAAADLSALAGADVVRGRRTGDPCTVARAVAERNHAALRSCSTDFIAGTIKVDVSVKLPAPWPKLKRSAVAGPPGPKR